MLIFLNRFMFKREIFYQKIINFESVKMGRMFKLRTIEPKPYISGMLTPLVHNWLADKSVALSKILQNQKKTEKVIQSKTKKFSLSKNNFNLCQNNNFKLIKNFSTNPKLSNKWPVKIQIRIIIFIFCFLFLAFTWILQRFKHFII